MLTLYIGRTGCHNARLIACGGVVASQLVRKLSTEVI